MQAPAQPTAQRCRFLYTAKAQSDFGDYLARVALTFLVFGRSHLLPLGLTACGVQIVMFAKPVPAIYVAVFFVVGLAGVFSTILNPIFVRAVDPAYRGRAMGVAVAGINLAQGTAAVTAGLFARTLGAAHTVGLYGATGAAVNLLVGVTVWPRREQ